MASFLQYTLPGSPSLYYADETGMEGFKDPFNRRTYPWGQEDRLLLAHYRQLGKLRAQHSCLRLGSIAFTHAANGMISFTREHDGKRLRVYCNRSSQVWEIPAGKLLFGCKLHTVAPDWLTVGPMGMCILED